MHIYHCDQRLIEYGSDDDQCQFVDQNSVKCEIIL